MGYTVAPGTATAVGSLPGEDIDEACRIVLGELPDLPHLPELPGRGVGADMVGRTAALLVDLHVDLQPAGWRLVDRAGADEGRAEALLRQDLDALEIHAHGVTGPLKVQVAGPLTLAATLELSRGDRALGDHSARRDLAESLAEGVAAHIADVRRRLPGAEVVLQVDEPALPAVLAGEIPTASGFSRHRAVEEAEAEAALAQLTGLVPYTVVHCCAAEVPVRLLRRAGAGAVSFDPSLLQPDELPAWAEAVDRGLDLFVGVVPTSPSPTPVADLVRRVLRLWASLDQGAEAAAARTVVTPACGLAGLSPAAARSALSAARKTAAGLATG